MGRPRRRFRAINGAEQDWTSGWRAVLHFNPGTGRFIKRGINRRERRAAQGEIEEQLADHEEYVDATLEEYEEQARQYMEDLYWWEDDEDEESWRSWNELERGREAVDDRD